MKMNDTECDEWVAAMAAQNAEVRACEVREDRIEVRFAKGGSEHVALGDTTASARLAALTLARAV